MTVAGFRALSLFIILIAQLRLIFTDGHKGERRMHTLDLLDYMIDLARRLGYEVREEWLDGTVGGACELKGQRILFVDLSLAPLDRLDQLASSLRSCAELAQIYVLPEVREVLEHAA